MGIAQALAGLEHAQRRQLGKMLLHQVCGLFKDAGPGRCAAAAPGRECICADGQGPGGDTRRGIPYLADEVPGIGRVVNGPGRAAQGFPIDHGYGNPFTLAGV